MNCIEIFKTNVTRKQHANCLVKEIQELFPQYTATIDLKDCDKVLRVESKKGKVEASKVINLLHKRSFHCMVMN